MISSSNKNVRKYTKLLLDRVKDGVYDKDSIIQTFCSYLSEYQVHDMLETNEFLFEEDEDDEDS